MNQTMLPFTEDVIEIISSIPPGKVATYGQIAKIAGSPRGARQVVRILHTMTRKYDLPWHRVINGKGIISINDPEHADLQKLKLQEEKIEVEGLKIDLDKFGWDGSL